MTASSWAHIEDPVQREMLKRAASLRYQIEQLKYQQLAAPHIADSLQPRIDRLETLHDSYMNKQCVCVCGIRRGDHVRNKCPFGATQFRDQWDLRNFGG